MLKKRWRDIVVVAVCTVAVIVTAVLYSVFTSQHIFDESSNHLLEIYGQLNTRVYKQIENERSLLKSWKNYIANSLRTINDPDADPADVQKKEDEFNEFLLEQRNEWKFSDFYFIQRPTAEQEEADKQKPDRYKYDYTCISSFSQKQFVVTLRRSLRNLLDGENGGNGGVVGILKGDDESEQLVMLFAVRTDDRPEETPTPLPEYTYKGVPFTAIGISFGIEKMLQMLDVDVFGESGEFYIALEDGTVLLQSGGSEKENYISYLESRRVTGRSMQDIHADFASDIPDKDSNAQKAGTVLVTDRADGDKYVTYMPIGFGNWMLIGVAPADVVNASMSWFRTVTIIVMVAIFVVALGAVAWVMILRNRRHEQEQRVALKSRENLFDLLTLNTNNLFILFSPDTFKAEYVSANIKQVLGLDVDAVKNDVHTVLSAAVGKYTPFTTEGLKTLPAGQTWNIDLQMRHTSEDKTYWFQLSLYRTVYNDADSFIMMFSDRTEERNLNANLQDALKIAKSANEAKSNFLSNMSHDIRTPMNAIIGFATLLARDADKPDKVREYIRKISFSGQHLLSLINDILDMSKIESGKTTLNIEEFGFSEYLEELYSIIVPQANAKKHTFEMYTKGRLPERVLGDRLRLNQVLLNLLSNAVKYTPDGGQIELTVEALDKTAHNHTHLRISVKDNGIGMQPEFLKEIFDPFARETSVGTRGIQGTGLGMAIAKNIVDLMGGTISVESEPGKGSTFTVEIELAIAGRAVADDDTDFWLRHNVTRVLVVDDEVDICTGVQELMSGTGVDVDYALSGKAAVQKVSDAFDADNAYHIVLIDWKMPEMDGIETAKRIRKKVGPDVPIMVLTSYSFDSIEEDAKEAGINLFLPKPFFVSNFRSAIEKLREGESESMQAIPGSVDLSGLKVLAAEDNEINAEILMELLEIENVQCEVASNGKEAVERFEQSAPGTYDVIFMDVQMPVMNGYEATRAIRASEHPQAKTIPIIAMTANAFDDDVRQALDSGMNAHLAKPIDMEKLKNIIAELRDGKSER